MLTGDFLQISRYLGIFSHDFLVKLVGTASIVFGPKTASVLNNTHDVRDIMCGCVVAYQALWLEQDLIQ